MGKVSKEYHQEYYRKKKQYYVDLLGGKCRVCGSIHDLTFDHKEPKSRKFKIAKILKRKKEIVLKELKKCQLLCKECHKKKSISEGSYSGKHGRKLSNLDVKKIYKLLEDKEISINRIAKKFNVTHPVITSIKNGTSYKDVER